MLQQSLGNTLIIANPTAHSGRGEAAAIHVTRYFSSNPSTANACSVQLTERVGDACRMAAGASGYETVIAMGGDGVVHEVVNGLMKLAASERPKLGVIPVGSGNDFARTLGIPRNDAERAIATLMDGDECAIDLGRVNDTYFAQTVSFGLDAAIAIDTSARRASHTRQSGAALYFTSGLRLMATGLRGWPYKAVVDGVEFEGTDVAFAVQNGPTYGGGFRICPKAVPNDGELDLCVSVKKPSTPHSLMLFGLARFGRHTRSRKLLMRKVLHIEVEFPGEDKPPCQVDGEELVADRYVIDVVPGALRVIVPAGRTW